MYAWAKFSDAAFEPEYGELVNIFDVSSDDPKGTDP